MLADALECIADLCREEPVTVFETPTYFDEDLGKEVDDPEYTRDGDMVVQ